MEKKSTKIGHENGLKHPCAFMGRFCDTMESLFYRQGEGCGFPEKVAVAVSGGADSMSLCHALSDYVQAYAPQTQIYILSVDHRLRPEAAKEARWVGETIGNLPNVSHHILVWEHGAEQNTRIEERAREARYGLLFGFMAEHGIDHLFIGHHQNDQAETFLFRLAKGSGLDGLVCMPQISETVHNGRHFVLCRPLLKEQKSDILDFVSEFSILYVNDPSNKDDVYARVRLRQSMDALSREGLTPKRLYTTSKRIKRARDAIEYLSETEYKKALKGSNTRVIVLDAGVLVENPLEIVIRVILKAIKTLKGNGRGYGPRLERVENLCEDLMQPSTFRKRTLHGIIFEYKAASREVVLSLEK